MSESHTLASTSRLHKLVEDNAVDIGGVSLSRDSKGHLRPKTADSRQEFHYTYRGVRFSVVGEADGETIAVRTGAVLGRIPFTMESSDNRANAKALAEAMQQTLKDRVYVDNAQQIIFEDRRTCQADATAVLASAIAATLDLVPYFDFIESVTVPPR